MIKKLNLSQFVCSKKEKVAIQFNLLNFLFIPLDRG